MRLIGRGGMGEVYLVRDTKLGRRAALKVVSTEHLGSPEAIESFLFEARTTARFAHPNIVTIHAVGEYEGRPYVALEYLEGQNLRERLFEQRPSLPESLRIALSVAQALTEAHRNGVLHLDLKPENVVLPHDGRVRVVDFGLAKTFRVGDDDTAGEDAEVAPTGWGTPDYVAPEQWRYQPTSEATDVWALGVIMFELLTHEVPFPPEPSLAKGKLICASAPAPRIDARADVPHELADLVADCLRKDPHERPTAAQVAARLEALMSNRRRPETEDSPFRGLLPFTSRDADFFFGREPEVAAFVERLRREPVLTIVGPPGAGKSSFVQAGVVARLQEQERWIVIHLRPGSRPFSTLAARIRRAEHPPPAHRSDELPRAPAVPVPVPVDPSGPRPDSPGVAQLAEALERSPHALALTLRHVADEQRARVLLLVEQLEELFTLVPDPEARARFMRAVCTAADDPFEPVRVVLTARDDFLGRLATGPEAREALTQVVVIESLAPQALTEILVKPVEEVGYRYEDPEIVAEMTAAVRGQPGSLPLLQFAAQRLWELRDAKTKVLLRSAYDAMGGVEGALAQHADGILDGLSDEDRRAARTLLTRLVTPERTRKVVPRAQALDGLGPRAEAVFDRLTQGRLIAVKNPRHSAAGPQLELIHESLIRKWDTLGRWLDEGREEHAFLEELGQAADLWIKRHCPPDELWRGDALHHALRMAERCAAEVPEASHRFLDAARAREQRNQRRRRFSLAAVISALLSIAVGAVVVALFVADKEHEAREQRDLAEGQRAEALQAASRAALEQGAMLEARARLRAALEAQDSPGGRALWWRLQADPRRWTKELGSLVYAVDVSPDGRTVAAGCQDTAIYLVDTETRDTRVLRGSDDQVYAVAFAPDGGTLASGTWSGRVDVWGLESGSRHALLDGHRGAVRGLAFSPDGSRLASSSSDGTVKVWGLPDGELLAEADLGQRVSAVDFDPSGTTLALATDDGVRMWRPGEDARPFASTDGAVFDVEIGPDGKAVAAAGNDNVVHVWNAATGTVFRTLTGHRNGVHGVSFSPDGTRLASASYDKTLRIWDLASGRQERRLAGHEAGLEGVAFGPDGEQLATAGRDRTVRLWTLRRRGDRQPEPGHTAGVYRVAFSPDGNLLASASGDQTVRLWDVESGESVRTLTGHSAGIDCVTFSPDGSLLASGSVDLTVRVWDVKTGAERQVLTGHAARVSGVAFSPDGSWLASAGRDNTIRIHDVASGAAARVLSAHAGGAYGVDFSRDGRRLVTGGADGKVVVWDTTTWLPLRSLDHGSEVHGVAFDPGGHRVASGGDDGMARIWDLGRDRSDSLGPHGGRVYWLEFDPSGTRLAAPSSDGSTTILEPRGPHPAGAAWPRGRGELGRLQSRRSSGGDRGRRRYRASVGRRERPPAVARAAVARRSSPAVLAPRVDRSGPGRVGDDRRRRLACRGRGRRGRGRRISRPPAPVPARPRRPHRAVGPHPRRASAGPHRSRGEASDRCSRGVHREGREDGVGGPRRGRRPVARRPGSPQCDDPHRRRRPRRLRPPGPRVRHERRLADRRVRRRSGHDGPRAGGRPPGRRLRGRERRCPRGRAGGNPPLSRVRAGSRQRGGAVPRRPGPDHGRRLRRRIRGAVEPPRRGTAGVFAAARNGGASAARGPAPLRHVRPRWLPRLGPRPALPGVLRVAPAGLGRRARGLGGRARGASRSSGRSRLRRRRKRTLPFGRSVTHDGAHAGAREARPRPAQSRTPPPHRRHPRARAAFELAARNGVELPYADRRRGARAPTSSTTCSRSSTSTTPAATCSCTSEDFHDLAEAYLQRARPSRACATRRSSSTRRPTPPAGSPSATVRRGLIARARTRRARRYGITCAAHPVLPA